MYLRTLTVNNQIIGYSQSIYSEEEGITIIEIDKTVFEINELVKGSNITDWKFENGEIIPFDIDSYLEELKSFKKNEIKKAYLEDIVWTDDVEMWYTKIKYLGKNSSEDDTAYNDVSNYWDESNTHYRNQKTALKNATTKEEILSIFYAPTHSIPKEALTSGDVIFDRKVKIKNK